ncbi:mannitol dehydrogenase family protein [Subtercola endophyticus]|uniref:mannitol dehydrogenase family protein n=1 Tax=Subtercola endophyticus TaxID=2895559 RepID=UPI001E2B48BA|nr:mannitol dehydrogenase family protein [Subtercola endophyticus]UFS58259.1 mannitol dehydrogenase family protein [Subtercola endophyticus]
MSDVTPTLLTRAARAERGDARQKPPVRLVHLGLGAFHRAHQAWYTARADDAAEWGIAAFTGHSTALAGALEAQDGLYTLIVRGAETDRFEVVDSIVEAHTGGDLLTFIRLLASPAVAVLTLTITESAYHLRPDSRLNLAAEDVRHDINELTRLFSVDFAKRSPNLVGNGPFRKVDGLGEVRTALGRVLVGLEARRRGGGSPIAIVPCDNIPGNGSVVRAALEELAAAVAAAMAAGNAEPLRDWMRENVSFVSTSVDRITPRSAPADRADVTRATGWIDDAPVVTEPFTDWVLSGDFPAGRPAWHTAGARFVDDIEPWENRKLWMLNGAHTLLAAAGRLRGHATVAQAVLDPVCREAVEALWNEDARHLTATSSPDLDLDTYRAALLERFENPRIEHHLEQIGQNAATKLQLRVLPVAERERAAGHPAAACANAVGAWLAWSRHSGEIAESLSTVEAVTALDAALGGDSSFLNLVDRSEATWQSLSQKENP